MASGNVFYSTWRGGFGVSQPAVPFQRTLERPVLCQARGAHQVFREKWRQDGHVVIARIIFGRTRLQRDVAELAGHYVHGHVCTGTERQSKARVTETGPSPRRLVRNILGVPHRPAPLHHRRDTGWPLPTRPRSKEVYTLPTVLKYNIISIYLMVHLRGDNDIIIIIIIIILLSSKIVLGCCHGGGGGGGRPIESPYGIKSVRIGTRNRAGRHVIKLLYWFCLIIMYNIMIRNYRTRSVIVAAIWPPSSRRV